MSFFLVLSVFGFLMLQETKYEKDMAQREAAQKMQMIGTNIEKIFIQQIERAKGLSTFYSDDVYVEKNALSQFAENLFKGANRIMKTVALTESGTIVFIYPLEGNEAALGVDLLKVEDQNKLVKEALRSQKAIVSKPVNLVQGGTAFIYWEPLSVKASKTNEAFGLMTLTLDSNELLAESGLENMLSTYDVQIVNIESNFDESIIFKSGSLKREDAVSVDFFPVNQHWKMTAYPRAGWQVDWMLRLLIGISGLASAFASYFVLKMLIKKNEKLDALVDKKTIELQKTNGELEMSLAVNQERQAELELSNARLEDAFVNLQKAQEQLVLMEKMGVISELVSGVAHRLNTPIGNVKTMISFVKMKIHEFQSKICENTNLHVEAEAFVESVNESIALIEGSLNRTVDIITTFKTLTQDSLQTEEEAVEVKDCLQSLLLEYQYNNSINATIEVGDGIVINTIRGVFQQAFGNLIKFYVAHIMDDQESQLNIVVEQNTKNCILRVTLSGVKVSKMFEEKMFEPHLMVSSESSLNGLELFIAHQLVTQILNGSMDHEVLNDTEHLYTIKL